MELNEDYPEDDGWWHQQDLDQEWLETFGENDGKHEYLEPGLRDESERDQKS